LEMWCVTAEIQCNSAARIRLKKASVRAREAIRAGGVDRDELFIG